MTAAEINQAILMAMDPAGRMRGYSVETIAAKTKLPETTVEKAIETMVRDQQVRSAWYRKVGGVESRGWTLTEVGVVARRILAAARKRDGIVQQ